MRLLGQIPHPHLKISVFKNDNRLSVKFENAGYELTCKLGDDERFKSVSDIAERLDADYLAAVEQQMAALHAARLGWMTRQFPVESNEYFPEII
jgi:hypothetical protein